MSAIGVRRGRVICVGKRLCEGAEAGHARVVASPSALSLYARLRIGDEIGECVGRGAGCCGFSGRRVMGMAGG